MITDNPRIAHIQAYANLHGFALALAPRSKGLNTIGLSTAGSSTQSLILDKAIETIEEYGEYFDKETNMVSETPEYYQGDWVYFTKEYDAGNVVIPAETGGYVNNDRSSDEMPVAIGHQQIEIDMDGRYYEIEVPESVIDLQ